MSSLADTVLPLLALVLCGYLAGRSGVLGRGSAASLNDYVYYFALPALLFLFTSRAPVAELLNGGFIAAFLLGSLGVYAVAVLVARAVFGRSASASALFALTAAFANTAYLGIPLFEVAFGLENIGPAVVATVAGNTVLIGGTIVLLEGLGSSGGGPATVAGMIARRLIVNPLIVAPLLALPLAFSGIGLVSPLESFLDLLGTTAGPAALFALGLSFVEREVEAPPGELAAMVALKLVVHPLATALLAFVVFDIEPFWAFAAVLLSATPTGALAFVMAQQRGVYVTQVSAAIVISAMLSVITISALVVLAPDV